MFSTCSRTTHFFCCYLKNHIIYLLAECKLNNHCRCISDTADFWRITAYAIVVPESVKPIFTWLELQYYTEEGISLETLKFIKGIEEIFQNKPKKKTLSVINYLHGEGF